ncbi:MAG: ARMT1-like domain-containing protein [Phycisphaerae bacterium]
MPASPDKPFVLLADPSLYVACNLRLDTDAGVRDYWLSFFKSHVRTILDLGTRADRADGKVLADVERRREGCLKDFDAYFDAFAKDPTGHGPVTILTLDQWRDVILRRHGFIDPMRKLKDAENEKVLPMLSGVCRKHDERTGHDQLFAIIEGVFAGNIFDMGAKATASRFTENGGVDFMETVASVGRKTWHIDEYRPFEDRMLGGAYRRAVVFIDNAGSDFILGMTPLCRYLCQQGVEVVIAANEKPTLNDMTVFDVRKWWPRILELVPDLADLPIEIVSTGTAEPLIDLAAVSDELNAAAEGADLVILEGMGRGVESNLNAEFKVDALNLAMLKDETIATSIGGQLYDVVCRFRRGTASPA